MTQTKNTKAKANQVQKDAPNTQVQSDAEKLRARILGYMHSKREHLSIQLGRLESAIADTGVDTQRTRAEQAAKIRDRIIDIEGDIATITFIGVQ